MTNSSLVLLKNNFFPDLFPNESLSITQLGASSFRFAQFLWNCVEGGAEEDRSSWDAVQWQHYLTDPRCEFYAVYSDHEPAGYCEIIREPRLMRAKGGAVRIKAFGLLPEFAGEGLGSKVLTRMVEKAFATGATSINLKSQSEFPAAMLAICRKQGFSATVNR
jgi:ribosomal protein S18 acetylase RimI-like enzyme